MGRSVLIIKKGRNFPWGLMSRLEQEGYPVSFCMDRELLTSYLTQKKPEVLLVEGWSLPELKEIIPVCQLNNPLPPLLVLSEESGIASKVQVLEIGADDYIEIPYHADEVLARIKAHFRKEKFFLEERKNRPDNKKVFSFDHKKHEACKRADTLKLSIREYQLLKFLYKKEGQVFSRKALLETVWGYGTAEEIYCDLRTVDVTVRRLREKIEDHPKRPTFLLTKRGVGYYFQNQEEDDE